MLRAISYCLFSVAILYPGLCFGSLFCVDVVGTPARLREAMITYGDVSLIRRQSESGINYLISSSDDNLSTLRKDATGLVISAQNAELRNTILNILESSRGQNSVIFADVNHLGLVNYFQGGSQSGDTYITAVAEALVNAAGDRGFVFRWGGDEFVIILSTTEAQVLQQFSANIAAQMSDSRGPAARVFHVQAQAMAQEYKSIMRARSFDEVPVHVWRKFYPQEIQMAQRDFSQFQRDYEPMAVQRMRQSRLRRPSVSLGAARNLGASVMALAEQAAEAAKKTYRQQMGLFSDLEKYLGRPSLYATTPQNATPRGVVPTIVIAEDPSL